METPGAIILINTVNATTLSILASQLQINETITSVEFNARLAIDANYVNVVHLNKLRVLVTNTDYSDLTNRSYMDIVLYHFQGMVTVESNKFGPPSLTLPTQRLTIYELFRYINDAPVFVPRYNLPFEDCGIGGIVKEELNDDGGIYDANPDKEFNNPDWINRK
jgi:hypothetical protein